MANAVEQVLEDLGWNEGFRLPIANTENKRLEEEVERKTRERASLRAALENTQERIREIRKHASDIKAEENQRRRLLGAHSGEVEAEQRLYKLAQAEESKIQQDARNCEKKTKETDEKLQTLQSNVAKLTKKLESIKKNILVDRDKLLAWEERLNRKDERNQLIEQFVKSDEKTFKKVELERQTLSEKAETYRQAVVKSVGDIQELELNLEKSARLYNQAVKDRRQLMKQWSQSIQVLTQRDKSIYDALRDINELREIAKERMDSYQEQERFLQIQEQENKETEDNIRHLEKELMIRKGEQQKLASALDSFLLEYQVRKKELQDMARQVEDTRASSKRKKNDLENKELKMTDCKARIKELKETLKNIDHQKMNTEERTCQLQELLEREEKRKASMLKETNRQQSLLLKSVQRQSELEGEVKVACMRQQAEFKRHDQLKQEQVQLEKFLKDRREWVYRTDLEVQRCEMRLALVMGQVRDKEELEAKQQRIEQLKRIAKEKAEVAKVLSNQLSQVENDVRLIAKAIESNAEEVKRLNNRKQDLALLIDGGEKQLKLAQAAYEERRVEESLLELKLKEATKIVAKVDDKLFDLEECAVHMEAAMQERRCEINDQRERLNMQKKILSAECGELRSVLLERRSRLQQLRSRYELLVATLGKNPEDGGPLTTAYLLIQSAQERYLLQERGNKLDMAIRKAEAEIRSMENTLRLVNVCNDKYKSSLSIVDDKGPEKLQQKKLDEELFEALDKLRTKRQALAKLQDDLKSMEDNCEQLDKDVKRVKDEKEDKREIASSLEQQITEQRDKISRADKNLRKVLKDVQNKCICSSDETIILQERDIAVRELSEQNNLALQRIAEFAIRHIEAEAYVKKLLFERNIELPSACLYAKSPATTTPRSSCASSSRLSTGRSSHANLTARSKLSLATGSREATVSRMRFEPDFSDTARTSKSTANSTQKDSSQAK
ncbi:hypothetical protein TKK_0002003 [Trichogramma kaykai]|uniref:Coiled-coil domain-containing protein 39 n=1 Tax=Trichogramma kaykai TaxID=54128 RepID=A0ABD2X8S4_9HYME